MSNNSTAPDPLLGVQNPSQQPKRTCLRCRRRKIKCDNGSPCANCLRADVVCMLAPPKRAPRRKDPVETRHGREAELVKRLNKLEGMVKELSSNVELPSDSRASNSNPVNGFVLNTGSESVTTIQDGSNKGQHLEKDMGMLMLSNEGRTRYIEHNFFAQLTEEVGDIVKMISEDMEDYGEETLHSDSNSRSIESDHQCFAFGYNSSEVNLSDFHPLPSQRQYYLDIFLERVDPFMKLFSVSLVKNLFLDAQRKPDSLSQGSEAFLFSVYFLVIASLSPDEVKSNLGLERDSILARFRFSVEQALARANFLATSDYTTLKAFVFYLNCIRCQDESRVGWSLARSAVGIARSLGLHRDGSTFGLSPFKTEMRRRLWWQICILDFRMAEKHGTEPSIVMGSFDTKLPLNINDEDLDPDCEALPEPRKGLTDMSYTLLACEITSAAAELRSSLASSTKSGRLDLSILAEQEQRIRKFQTRLEDHYVQYCTDITPWSWIISRLCKIIICKLESSLLLLFKEKPGVTSPQTDKLFLTSIRILELRRELESDITGNWHWYLRTVVQWHSIAYLLNELCVRKPGELTVRAWRILDLVFQGWQDLRKHGAPRLLSVPMRKLIVMARKKRALNEIRETPHLRFINSNIEAHKRLYEPQENITAAQQLEYAEMPLEYNPQRPFEDPALLGLGFEGNMLGDIEWEEINDSIPIFELDDGFTVDPRGTFMW